MTVIGTHVSIDTLIPQTPIHAQYYKLYVQMENEPKPHVAFQHEV